MNVLTRIRKRMMAGPADDRGCERKPEWYDEYYRGDAREVYATHYTNSPYYFVWSVIADRLPISASILEIGCGSGQLAHLLWDSGIRQYLGFDFSKEAVAIAAARCTALEFQVADALATPLLQSRHYDVVICTEVLEHIEEDLQLVSRIKPGTRCLLTVPNFPYISHVRHFQSTESVIERYGSLLSELRISWKLMREQGQGFFLLDGIAVGDG